MEILHTGMQDTALNWFPCCTARADSSAPARDGGLVPTPGIFTLTDDAPVSVTMKLQKIYITKNKEKSYCQTCRPC